MPWIIGGAILGSSLLGSNASNNAADAQVGASDRAAENALTASRETNALNERVYNRQREDALDLYNRQRTDALDVYNQQRSDVEPWRKAGTNALAALEGYMPDLIRKFDQSDFQADPGYNFRLSEGMKGIERSAAARGNLLSGGVLKGITRYGQDMASNEYQNSYNRFNQDQTTKFNRIASVAGLGQNATQQLGSAGSSYGGALGSAGGAYGGTISNAGSNYATNAGNTTMGGASAVNNALIGGANARASGYVGGANAFSSALGQGLNYYQNQQFMNMLHPSENSFTYGTP